MHVLYEGFVTVCVASCSLYFYLNQCLVGSYVMFFFGIC